MRSDLNLYALEQFVALARTRNFTRAAEELHVSQPALSRSIRKLEDQLGKPLFERRPREVVLTELGEQLLERAREILRLIDETLTEFSETGRHPRIRLGTIPTIAPYFLPRVLGGFSAVRPDVRVVVQEDTTDQLLRRCSQGELDVVILALPVEISVGAKKERMQVKVRGQMGERFAITCNGRRVPLAATGRQGEFVAGVRYRAWQPPNCLHPTVGVHSPLTIDLVDQWNQRSLGGCKYHVAHPGGLSHETFPVNAYEAESRRLARFFSYGHTPGTFKLRQIEGVPEFPLTLDLRRS